MSAVPIQPIGAAVAADNLLAPAQAIAPGSAPGASFSELLMQGVEQVDQKLIDADALAAAFAINDSMPLHRVTYALEQARLSFELMLQVRTRLVEAYQDIARMQL